MKGVSVTSVQENPISLKSLNSIEVPVSKWQKEVLSI